MTTGVTNLVCKQKAAIRPEIKAAFLKRASPRFLEQFAMEPKAAGAGCPCPPVRLQLARLPAPSGGRATPRALGAPAFSEASLEGRSRLTHTRLRDEDRDSPAGPVFRSGTKPGGGQMGVSDTLSCFPGLRCPWNHPGDDRLGRGHSLPPWRESFAQSR